MLHVAVRAYMHRTFVSETHLTTTGSIMQIHEKDILLSDSVTMVIGRDGPRVIGTRKAPLHPVRQVVMEEFDGYKFQHIGGEHQRITDLTELRFRLYRKGMQPVRYARVVLGVHIRGKDTGWRAMIKCPRGIFSLCELVGSPGGILVFDRKGVVRSILNGTPTYFTEVSQITVRVCKMSS